MYTLLSCQFFKIRTIRLTFHYFMLLYESRRLDHDHNMHKTCFLLKKLYYLAECGLKQKNIKYNLRNYTETKHHKDVRVHF